MIVIAIIGILASVTLPALRVRTAVETCFSIQGARNLTACDTEAEIRILMSTG